MAQAQILRPIAREIANDAPKVWPYVAPLIGAGAKAVHDWWNSSSDHSKPADAPPAKPAAPAATAGAPKPEEPEEPKGEPSASKKKFAVPDREPSSDNPEDYELGWDRDRKEFRPEEVKTAWRLQELLQQPLRRSTIGGDWIAPDGKVYDAVGPAPDKFFDAKSFGAALDEHFLKSGIIPVVDLRGMAPAHIEQVKAYISSLPPSLRSAIIRIGF